MDNSDAKARLRSTVKPRRAAVHARLAATAPQAVLAAIAGTPQLARALTPGTIVAAYWPIGSELDSRPLLSHYAACGCICALPVVVRRGSLLIFRRWRPGMALEAGDFGTSVPPPASEEVVPRLVFAPLLAVDRKGMRLGYGAGFYDRTLRALRNHLPVIAVGLAYAGQIVDHVPCGPGDEALDWLVTEDGAMRIGAGDNS